MNLKDLKDGDRVQVTRTITETYEGTVVLFNGQVLVDAEEPGPWGSTVRHIVHPEDSITEAGSAVAATQPAGWRKLYEELGLEITMTLNSANDMTTPAAMSLNLASKAEGMQRARELMRDLDGTLPVQDEVDML